MFRLPFHARSHNGQLRQHSCFARAHWILAYTLQKNMQNTSKRAHALSHSPQSFCAIMGRCSPPLLPPSLLLNWSPVYKQLFFFYFILILFCRRNNKSVCVKCKWRWSNSTRKMNEYVFYHSKYIHWYFYFLNFH